MRVYLKRIIYSVIVVGSIFLIPIITFSKDYVAYYDDLFKDNKFTINTEKTVNDSDSLLSLIQTNSSYYSAQEYYDSPTNSSNLSLGIDSCDYDEMTCNFKVYRSKNENGNYTHSLIKEYNNIKIELNSNVNSYFNMVDSDNNIVINYDESMFDNENEKANYISNYFSTLSVNKENEYIGYSYNSSDKTLTRVDRNIYDSTSNLVAQKTINNIIFKYTEEPYSSDFKKLTDGTITIKSDVEITNDILSYYLSSFSNEISFSIDGNIKNNKAFIKMGKYENGTYSPKEKHLVNIVRQEEIDKSLFSKYNLDNYLEIKADEPENKSDYIMRYANNLNLGGYNGDGTSYGYTYNLIYGTNNVIIKYTKYAKNQNIEDVVFHKVEAQFKGYDETVSEDYLKEIGKEITVNSDEKSENVILNTLGYSGKVGILNCNKDYSICDIWYKKEETDTVLEIHKVNIKFDNTISDDFKKGFSLNEDNSIDILIDDNAQFNYLNYYDHDKKTNNNYEYSCDRNNKCTLSLRNYSKNKNETHKVTYNIIKSDRSQYYLDNVLSSISLYPGENTDIWNSLVYNGNFSKSNAEVNVLNCSKNSSTCSVILKNDNNKLEIHKTTVNLIEGMSPEFKKAFANQKIEINGIYQDDLEYLDSVSSAYLMGRTKSWAYLEDYADNKAKIYYEGIESHTLDVSFAKGNSEHQKIVDNYIKKLDSNPLSVKVIDLGFVNEFYYNNNGVEISNNFNSKQLNDDFYKVINDKHIGYYYLPRAGMEEEYLTMSAGNLILYYDGISYGQTNGNVNSTLYNIIYIPDETENTKEAFIKAAQKRVDDYLGKNSGVLISYKGPSNLENVDYIDIDLTGTDNNAYYITQGNKEKTILIIKDSSKMQKSTFIASDVLNNINVTSEKANYPFNTIVSSDRISKQNELYNKILNKLQVKEADIIDINLYSTAIGNIKNFNGVNFEVSLPLNNSNLNSDNLYAYYIDDNGNIEEHKVKVDDFMAQFETTHFSTYIISEKIDSNVIKDASDDIKQLVSNPKTYDQGIKNYVIIGIISLIGLIAIFIVRKKINN